MGERKRERHGILRPAGASLWYFRLDTCTAEETHCTFFFSLCTWSQGCLFHHGLRGESMM